MKTVKIGNVQYPIVLVDSIDQVNCSTEAIQCLQTKPGHILAYFCHDNMWFSATKPTSVAAADRIAEKIVKHGMDCEIRCEIDGVSFETRSRHILIDPASGVETLAPYGVIHWWTKGYEGSESYKCDIHFLLDDGELFTLEGVGATLEAALHDLTSSCMEQGFGQPVAGDIQSSPAIEN